MSVRIKERPHIAAVVNPAAGGDPDGAVAALASAGIEHQETVRTSAAGDAADIAYKLAVGDAPPDVIAAVGGDGTVHEVVSGLHRARESGAAEVPPLLIVPAGTGNSSYRGLWNDEPWDTVAEHVARGEAAVRPIDLARIEQNDHISLLGSGSGLFAYTLVVARGRPEKGRDLLMAAALAAMADYVPYPGRVVCDGNTVYEGDIVETIVGGFRYRGGLLCLVPESIVDDRLLDITVVTAAVDMGAFAGAALGGNVYEVPGILTARGEHITIERLDGQPMLFEHDGELQPELGPSYDYRVVPAALRVLTPLDPPPWFQAG